MVEFAEQSRMEDRERRIIPMIVNTTRFGQVEVDDSRVIVFPKGLLGFPSYTRYVLIEPGEDSYFLWLQSTQTPDLAFVVTDPSLFVPTYKVPIKQDQMRELGIASLSSAQVFVIVNKVDRMLTGNLQGPLVINVATKVGEQLVLSDRRFTTRVPLVELGSPVEAMSA
ncbi:MAG TPA: hypothetical protein DCM28_04380 [Phycisphaerales bacterium]|nr:hypothetical protein [Phycisphaerales bacterium]HCD34107.1 hypothetical protein [Phycisphaerales bacterium]|tara:strand:+ start:943 stop:1446 length:504 start_codon:yes stop_codon:yes gene_type:complete